MFNTEPQHYSYCFRFNMKKLPAKATDRFQRTYLFFGLIFGILLMAFASAFFINISPETLTDFGQGFSKEQFPIHTFLSPKMFGLLNFLLGASLLYATFIRFGRRKDISFDGKKINVKEYYFSREIMAFEEPLYNYSGVRLRVQFYQFGIFTRNKFIIELLHKEPEKTIPLYISMRSRSIRRLWREYAAFFKMPALKISDKGMVSYNPQKLELPYKENIKEWHLPENFLSLKDKPSYIILRSRSSGEKMIKIRKIFLDAYNFLAALAIIVLGGLAFYAISIKAVVLAHLPLWTFALLLAMATFIVVYAVLSLLTADIIVLARNKIILFRKTLFFRVCHGIMHVNDIKGIDINYVPTLNRYYIAVVSNQETLIFGQKMPVKDLRFLRALLIHEIVGN